MKILIASDGSAHSRAAADFAAGLIARPGETEVRIVSVVEPAAFNELETLIEETESLTDPSNPAARRADAAGKQLAEEFGAKFSGSGIEISNEVLGGPAARMIVERAEEWGADLIVVGSHGYGLWLRALLGSVSDRVAQHAPCPILIVRSKE
jgi:nucleotide-binding universal stress UspA family protein